MPTLVWHYLTALLYDRTSASGVALAEALETVSHDRLTRLLQTDWSGQRLLELACRTLLGWSEQRYQKFHSLSAGIFYNELRRR